MPPDMRKTGVFILAAYIAIIPAANWLVSHYGPVPVGFGLLAPAGVYLAGLAFTLRDLVQETLGRRVVLAAIAAGTILSLVLADGRIALASGTAFLLSELADFGVYTPLRERRWLLAVAASNAVGLLLDSVLFLWVAFGSFAFLPGQLVGKTLMTAAALPVLWLARRALLPRHA